MITPVIILGLLVTPFLLVAIFRKEISKRQSLSPESLGCIGISLVLCFTGVSHFIQTRPMSEMLPTWVPARIQIVYLTGVIELAMAVFVLITKIRRPVGWALIFMLIAFLPINVYAAINQVGMGGHQWGPIYLFGVVYLTHGGHLRIIHCDEQVISFSTVS